MPKMGDAMTEGKILRWMKRPGDAVAVGEPIAEIETDKVNVELPAEEAGTLLEVLAQEGQSVPVGHPIAVIGRPGEQPGTATAPARAAPGAEPAASRPATPAEAPTPAPARVPAEERIKASPLARRLAREHGVDLAAISGTGPEGRITKEDVEAYLARTAAAAPAAPGAPAPPLRTEEVPLGRPRRTVAQRMVEAKGPVPHFYVTVEIRMDAALDLRRQLNAALGEKVVSVNDLVVKAAALALRAFPNLNASYRGETVRRYGDVHVGVAVDRPEGLIVPVIRHADRKGLVAIAREARDLAERARTGRLRPEELEGGTFTVSNLGMFEVESFAAIINPPQAAILAVGTALPRAVVEQGQVRAAHVMKATLSADHRVTDGAEAARYLAELRRLLEMPLLLVVEPDTLA